MVTVCARYAQNDDHPPGCQPGSAMRRGASFRRGVITFYPIGASCVGRRGAITLSHPDPPERCPSYAHAYSVRRFPSNYCLPVCRPREGGASRSSFCSVGLVRRYRPPFDPDNLLCYRPRRKLGGSRMSRHDSCPPRAPHTGAFEHNTVASGTRTGGRSERASIQSFPTPGTRAPGPPRRPIHEGWFLAPPSVPRAS